LKFAPNSIAPNFEPDWNKPPTAPMLVAIRSVNGERIPKMMKWGLIAHWAKDDKLQYSTFNARAEEFTTKPAFRDAWTALTANHIVVVPIRSGIGLRLGANLGYLKFTDIPTWNPF
jgi:putative SOS response-associated peptidase YedK